MKLLALDTSTKIAGAALMEDGMLVCEANLNSGLTHSERLMPLVDQCFRLAGWQPGDLDAIAVVAGPGSFTGVRIGVATAKGMAEALGKAVIAVNTLEVLAAGFPGYAGVIAPILDARRDQVYCALYDGNQNELLAPTPLALDGLLAHPAVAGAQAIMFCGDGVAPHKAAIAEALGDQARFAPVHLMLQRSGAAAHLAWKRLLAGQTMDPADLLPIYLRKSSAEQVLDKKASEAANGR